MFRYAVALLALATLVVGVQAQQSDRIPISYETLSPEDPRTSGVWDDMRNIISYGESHAHSPVEVMFASFPTSNGNDFVIQVLTGGGTCGFYDCTTRVVENGVIVATFQACDDFSTHAISSDGTQFYACDAVIDLTK